MPAFFVTATGTDAGKTFLTTALIRHLRAKGRDAAAFKPVASGFDPAAIAASDTGRLLAAMGRPLSEAECAPVSPWRFAAPLSPDMAAARENRAIDFPALVGFSRKVATSADVVFIEGVGGVMVPLDDTHTVLDWIEALAFPSVLLAGTYLGAISHALTALDALSHRNCAVQAIVLNETRGSRVGAEETHATIARFARGVPVCPLPYIVDDGNSDRFVASIAAVLGL